LRSGIQCLACRQNSYQYHDYSSSFDVIFEHFEQAAAPGLATECCTTTADKNEGLVFD